VADTLQLLHCLVFSWVEADKTPKVPLPRKGKGDMGKEADRADVTVAKVGGMQTWASFSSAPAQKRSSHTRVCKSFHTAVQWLPSDVKILLCTFNPPQL
jgi:hypothetical protein